MMSPFLLSFFFDKVRVKYRLSTHPGDTVAPELVTVGGGHGDQAQEDDDLQGGTGNRFRTGSDPLYSAVVTSIFSFN